MKFTGLFFFISMSYLVSSGQMSNSSKPLLGWNSWDSYGMYPTEKAMLANLRVFEEKLKPFGYTYFVIDAGWDVEKDNAGKITHLSIDQYCRYIPAKSAFPEGIKYIADSVHSKGLKFGLHIMRGIPRDAYRKNLPVLNTNYTARDIADTSSTCRWNKDNYGVDMSKPGAQAYYDSYIGQLISWGVDFIKADDITAHPAEVQAVKEAIRKTGKNIILSLSPGGDSQTENVAAYNEANMLRVTNDVWDNQKGFAQAFNAWKKWAPITERKFWLDMDMIPFGHLCLHNPDADYLHNNAKQEAKKAIKGKERMSAFTDDEKYTFITLRALSASPLFMGGDLPTSDSVSFRLITNKEILKCNQNGVVGKLIYSNDSIEVWKTADKSDPKKGWIGIFNRSADQQKQISLTMQDMEMIGNKVNLYDVWNNKNSGVLIPKKSIENTVNGNGVVFYTYSLN